MARLNTDQLRRRDQFESVIRIAEPFLNVVLAVGDRLSRAVEPEDKDYSPPRAPTLSPPAASEPAEAAIAPVPEDDAG